ncbi:putative retrotransposon protein with integrase and ribonuclease H-like domain [Klebsormidium nitens]|uniref:Putative retrotransposon protein with integrase and ribonuclease H-like domain n=1 Tax=Klebsormidium nitens TaxID=105231 RepID=A0A1Y1INM1_KLENI|nr:putative retrotransposon protein with integrase and ribonuclease H-like domain [Klebsormidium nitens]|eukprot:GAQ92495.1 putative retrotransposon protein with integrase and ribonuclease H-like domain [Klebsormidium nitens]
MLTTTKEELGKVEELLPTLQVFEQRHGLFGEQDSEALGSATAVAYAAKGGNFAGKGKGGPGKASMACHKCGAGVGTVELRCEMHSGERVNLSVRCLRPGCGVEQVCSVKKATAVVGAEVVFRGVVCEVSMDGEVMLRAEENAEGLSVICQPSATWEDTCLLVREAESPVLWHRRLGHAENESLAKMVEGPGLVRGVGTGGQSGGVPGGENVGGGSRYLATFLDDFSKLSVVQPMKRKSDVTAVTESVFARLELQSGKKVKSVQTDRGGEYVNEGMMALLGKRGTVQRTTAGHSPKKTARRSG